MRLLLLLLFLLPLAGSAATVDLKTGTYSGCPGVGCAKGDYRFGTNATVSSASFVITTPSGSFVSGDVGKRGVVMDWHATNVTGGSCPSGYACYSGVSCQFSVSAVNSSTSITAVAIAGCGSSGVGFNGSGNAYWAVYTDDSTALANALAAAAGGTLTVPSTYKGGIYTGHSIAANTTISCTAGATFWDPKLNTATTFMFTPGTNDTIDGCTLRGTEPDFGAYYDYGREYNIFVGVFASGVTIANSTFQDSWGTYMVGSSGVQNLHVHDSTFKNCGLYGVQLNNTGGTSPGTVIENIVAENCQVGTEDGSLVAGTPNRLQAVKNSYMYVTAQGGTGYFRSQTSRGLANTGASAVNAGVAASGRTPTCTTRTSDGVCTAGEYTGVTYSGNTVCGPKTWLQPCPTCPYHTNYGSVLTGNICNNGCNATPVTSACAVISPDPVPDPPTPYVLSPIVLGTTSTQAVLSYNADPTASSCNVHVFDDSGTEVNDTNTTLFANASDDLLRLGPATATGLHRQLIIGAKTSSLALSGAMASRALKADTNYTGTVACSTLTSSFKFSTSTLVLGDTSPNPYPYDANGFGNYAFPSINYSDLTKTYVDPQSGAVLKTLTDSGFAAAGIHPDPWLHIYDLANVWTNESNLLGSTGTATYTGTGGQNNGLFVPFHFQDGTRGYIFIFEVFVDDVKANLKAGSSIASDTLSACLVAYGDTTTCLGTPFKISIPQGTPASVSGPADFPNMRFSGWGSPSLEEDQGENDIPDGGSVAVSGSIVSNTTPKPGNFPTTYTFPHRLKAGTRILIAGSDPTCPLNECTIASVQDSNHLTITQNLGTFNGVSTSLTSAMPNKTTFTVGNAGGFIPSQRNNAGTWLARVGTEDVFCTTLVGNTFSGCNNGTVWPLGTPVTAHNYTIENWGLMIWPTAGASRTVTLAGTGSFNYASSADYTTGVEGDGMICSGATQTVSFAADGTTSIPSVNGKMCIVNTAWNDNIPLLGILIPSTGEFRTLAHLSSSGNSQDPINPLTVYESDLAGNVTACTYDPTAGHFRELPHYGSAPDPYVSCSSAPIITGGVAQIQAAYPQIDMTFFGQPKFNSKIGNYVTYNMNPYQDSLSWGCAFDISKSAGTELIACQDHFSHPGLRWGDQHGGGLGISSDNGWARFFSGDLGNLTSPSGPYRMAVTAVSNNGGVPSLTAGFDDPRTCEAMGATTAMQAKGATGHNCIEITTPAEPLHTSPPVDELTTTGTAGAKPQRWSKNATTCPTGAGNGTIPATLLGLGQGFECSSFLQPIIEGDWLKDTSPFDSTGQEFFLVAKKTVNGDGSLTLVLRRQISAGNFPTDQTQSWCVGQQGAHSTGSAVWYLKAEPERICGGNLYWTDVSSTAYSSSNPVWIQDDPKGLGTHTALIYSAASENWATWSVNSASLGGTTGPGSYGFGYGIRSGHIPEVFSSPVRSFPQYGVNSLSPFNADLNGTDSIQSHPGTNISYPSGATHPFLTGLDGRPFGTGGGADIHAFGQTVTLVSGKTGTYLISPMLGVSNMAINPKLKELMGWYGHTLLKNVSGPLSASNFTDSTTTSRDLYCYAYKAGECVTGSLAGNVYVSMLNADTTGTCKIDMTDRVPCVVPAAVHAFKYTQYDVTQGDPTGTRERVVSTFMNGAGNQENYANAHGTDGAGWIIGWARFANGQRSELMGAKDARWLEDSVNRGDFVKVPVQLSGRTGDTVRIRFGYDPVNLYCTQRQETCSTNPTTSTDPFAYTPTDAVTPQACGSGCTININAYANRVLYYIVDRTNGGITHSSSVNVLAVP